MQLVVMCLLALAWRGSGQSCDASTLTLPSGATVGGAAGCSPAGMVANGGQCTVTPPAGYQCNTATCNSGTWDSTSPCQPNGCNNGPVSPTPNVDYTPCNTKNTGDVCTPGCVNGFRKTAGSPFMLTCGGTNQYTDGSNTACQALCGPLPDQGASYDESLCSGAGEGGSCTLRCATGYFGGTATFVCNVGSAGGPPVLGAGQTLPNCAANPCNLGPTNPVATADYSSCNSQSSGGTCTVQCRAGYTKTTGSSFTLTCNAGQYTDLSATTCQANPCTLGASNPTANADYSTCTTRVSGNSCTPTCNVGYKVSVPATPFTLLCASGRFTDSSGIGCQANVCTEGPANPAANADYSQCNLLSTGGSCLPTCLPGFTRTSGTAFNLECPLNTKYTDRSGVICTGNPCSSGPSNAAANAVYTSCNTLRSGGVCTPVCAAGYELQSPVSFTLSCSGDRYTDTGGTVCRAASCTAGPTNKNPLADYTACDVQVTGVACNPTCATGYRKTGGTAFTLLCTTAGYVDSSGVTCSPNSCTAGPTVPTALVDYTACNAMQTGSRCLPTCPSGYSRSSGTSFTLECRSDGKYTDLSGAACVGNQCTAPANPAVGADYSSCNTQRTGSSCTPTCRTGFTKAAGGSFALSCTTAGVYTDTSGIACNGNACTTADPSHPNTDYSSCTSLVSGQTCSPTCSPGYTRGGTGSFTLTCDGSGKFTDPSKCQGLPCTGGATNPTARADYSDCTALVSGSTCSVKCAEGYTKEAGNDFMLTCIGATFTDSSGVKCSPAKCTGGPSNPEQSVDYTACNILSTGELCTPACQQGFVRTGGRSFPLVCDSAAGTYADTSSTTCTGNTCAQGPTVPSPHVDYSPCNRLRSGETCKLACQAGYVTTGGTTLVMSCTSNKYEDTSGVSCEGAPCSKGPRKAVDGADYSSCTGKKTGDTCSPGCVPGYRKTAGGDMALHCTNGEFDDTSGTTCEGEVCTGGPNTPSPNVDYTACNTFRSGQYCDPGCGIGYKKQSGSVPFQLNCVGTKYDDASGVVCQAAPCTGGPTNPQVNVDYSSCNNAATGDTCDPVCLNGFTKYNGTAFRLTCVGTRYTDSSGISCSGARCRGGPINPSPGVDYSSCNQMSSGDMCSPKCQPGYVRTGGLGAFALDCDGSNSMYRDKSGTICAAQECGLGAINPGKNVNYTDCLSKKSGDMCTPSCLEGFAKQTGGSIVPLTCAGGRFNDTSGVLCAGNSCTGGPTNPNPDANYSACNELSSGESCTPTCRAGYRLSSLQGAFALDCDAYQKYKDNSGIACLANTCRKGPRGSTNKVDYTDCLAKVSGEVCAAKCAPGYSVIRATSFRLVCTDDLFDDPTGGSGCVPRSCAGGPKTPTPDVDYTACNKRMSGEVCLPECRTGTVPTGGANFTLECDSRGEYVDISGVTCTEGLCTGGPRTPSPNVEYTTCNSKRSGETCTPTCVAGSTKVAGGAFVLSCDREMKYHDNSGLVCSVFTGECTLQGNVCTAVGQTCEDPSTTTSADWMCKCVSPATGTPGVTGPATCELDECNAVCPTCAGDRGGSNVCARAGQDCVDNDKTVTSDWSCHCPPPSIGTRQGGVAACTVDYDECAAYRGVCMAAGQECEDPNTKSVGDWVCKCVGGTATALNSPASCPPEGECITNVATCTSSNQTCVDPSPAADDWECRCIAPFTGNAGVGMPTTCLLDECTANTICSSVGQRCEDTDQTSLGDWECTCVSGPMGRKQGAPADCQTPAPPPPVDECLGNTVCLAAGQTCNDPSGAVGDWECQCTGQSTGSQQGGVATCTHQGECTTNHMVCQAAGQTCVDPDTSVQGDWQCQCVGQATGTPGNMAPAVCILDECTATSCPGQRCFDPDRTVLSDWECHCPFPAMGKAVGQLATCDLDECSASPCPVGQGCSDPSTTTTGDFTCSCFPPATGSATGKGADCQFPGECQANYMTCYAAGQNCADPGTGWECQCVDPEEGVPRKGGVASCTLDECKVEVCPSGQTCRDPDTAVMGDWECVCDPPASGTAPCVLDECTVHGGTCYAAGQQCRDPDTMTPSTWECLCIGDTVGALTRVAVCVQSGECRANSQTCIAAGQNCRDPSPASNNKDWVCECVPPATGNAVTEGPAICSLDECVHLAGDAICQAGGQRCVDPDTTVLGNWECHCLLPLTGKATTGLVATCMQDECQDPMKGCGAGQTCTDPVPTPSSLGDWECSCDPPATGTPAKGGDAMCILDECLTVTLCGNSGQDCEDPTPTPAQIGDWQCVCPAGSSGAPATMALATCSEVCSVPGVTPGYSFPDPSCTTTQSCAGVKCEPNYFGTSPTAICSGGAIRVSGCTAKCEGVTCPDPGVCREGGGCDEATGQCRPPTAKADGVPCDDGNPSTTGDSCRQGACVGEVTCGGMPCSVPPSCKAVGCVQGKCTTVDLPDETPCDDRDPNTVEDRCKAGVCAGTNRCDGVVCAQSGACYEVGTCDPASGMCTQPRKGAGSSCDDGNPTTTGDTCDDQGWCSGVVSCGMVQCRASKVCHRPSCGSQGRCEEVPVADGEPCNDNDMLTTDDKCKGGVCIGRDRCGTKPCSRLVGSCLQSQFCSKTTGECPHVPEPDGTSCDDSNPLTTSDTCYAGVCNLRCAMAACPPATECADAAPCDGQTGKCGTATPKPMGTPCDDGDPSTKVDQCDGAGVCVGNSLCNQPCVASDQCHDAGMCDLTSGICSDPSKADGTSCDDGDPSSMNDVCIGGGCAGEVVCSMTVCPRVSDPQCRRVVCDAMGRCSEEHKQNGLPCNDGDTMTEQDQCLAGVCLGTKRCAPCVARSPCHDVGVCDNGVCTTPLKPDGSPCDDGDPNTSNEKCLGGVCVGEVVCKGVKCPTSLCEVSSCVMDKCVASPRADGTACDDGNPVTVGDSCRAGTCIGDVRPTCDTFDASKCSPSALRPDILVVKCDVAGCTSDDCCLPDMCSAVTCTAYDTCHGVGVCNSKTGRCSNPIVPPTTPCDDNRADTVKDRCVHGVCTGTPVCATVKCLPRSQCHAKGDCDTMTGVCSSPLLTDGTPCDDGSAMTIDDTCQQGVCKGTPRCQAVACQASGPCHMPGTCSPATGLCTEPLKPTGTPCDDGLPETTGDQCTASGACLGQLTCDGKPCRASDQCKEPRCSGGKCDEVPRKDGTPCNDANPATHSDTCSAGVCRGESRCKGVVCSAPSPCYLGGTCNPVTGKCDAPVRAPEGSPCSDGDPVTVNDKCVAGQCIGESRCHGVTCTPTDQCHGAGECDPMTGLCSEPALRDGTICDDGDASTVDDMCTGGVCIGVVQCGGTACTPSGDARCMTMQCDPSTASCKQSPRPDGTACNDGEPSTVDDKCQSGVCVGKRLCDGVTCSTNVECHEAGVCLPLLGTCTKDTASPDGTACDDGDAMTTLDACRVGTCVGSPLCASKTCPAADECHEGSTCDPSTGECSDRANRPDGTACGDGGECKQGVCTTQQITAVRISIGVALPPTEVEARRAAFLAAVGAVIGIAPSDFNSTSFSHSSANGGTLADILLPSGDADAVKDLLAKAMQQGPSGVFGKSAFPVVSVNAERLTEHNECTGNQACAIASQECRDPTPYFGYFNDWICRCLTPDKTSATGRPANCGGGSTEVPMTPVPVNVAPTAISSSPVLTNITNPMEAWAKRLADAMGIPPSLVTATAAGPGERGSTKVFVQFRGSGAALTKRSFLEKSGCCPASCTGPRTSPSFCIALGIGGIILPAVPTCAELDHPDVCVKKVECAWNGNLCMRPAPPDSDDDFPLIAVIAPSVVVALLLIAALIWCCCREKKPEASRKPILDESSSDGAGAMPTARDPPETEMMATKGSVSRPLANEEPKRLQTKHFSEFKSSDVDDIIRDDFLVSVEPASSAWSPRRNKAALPIVDTDETPLLNPPTPPSFAKTQSRSVPRLVEHHGSLPSIDDIQSFEMQSPQRIHEYHSLDDDLDGKIPSVSGFPPPPPLDSYPRRGSDYFTTPTGEISLPFAKRVNGADLRGMV